MMSVCVLDIIRPLRTKRIQLALDGIVKIRILIFFGVKTKITIRPALAIAF